VSKNADIPAGANWDRSVEAALEAAEHMLLVMSPSASRSENVQDEWSYFVEAGKRIHVFVHTPCELPLRLRRRQRTMGVGDLLVDLAKIVESLATPRTSSGGEGDLDHGSLAPT
jgi:hypothetical protein